MVNTAEGEKKIDKTGLATKFLKKWRAPYKIIEKLSPITYIIENVRGRKQQQAVHVKRLKHFRERFEYEIDPIVTSQIEEEDEDEKVLATLFEEEPKKRGRQLPRVNYKEARSYQFRKDSTEEANALKSGGSA